MREMVLAAAFTGAVYAGICAGLLWLAGLRGVGASVSVAEAMGAVALVVLAEMAVAWVVRR